MRKEYEQPEVEIIDLVFEEDLAAGVAPGGEPGVDDSYPEDWL